MPAKKAPSKKKADVSPSKGKGKSKDNRKASRSPSPVRKISSSVKQLTDDEIKSIAIAALSAASSATVASASQIRKSKRKETTPDIRHETPTPSSPKKKRKQEEKPIVVSTPRSTRQRIKSAKAREMAESPSKAKRTPAVIHSPTKLKVGEREPFRKATYQKSRKHRAKSVTPIEVSSDESPDEEASRIASDSAEATDDAASDKEDDVSSKEDNDNEGSVIDVDESSKSTSPFTTAYNIVMADYNPAGPVDGHTDPEDLPSSVMQPAIQDSLISPSYVGLPHLPVFADVSPFGYDLKLGGYKTKRAKLSEVAKKMNKNDFKNLLAALLFVQHGHYVNFSRMDPSLFELNHRRNIKLRSHIGFCIGLMSGVSTDSHLVSSVQVGPAHSPYKQHRVTIIPFQQEIRRDTSAWGQILGFKVISGTTNSKGFAFVTRGDGKSVTFSNNSGYGYPAQPSTPDNDDSDMFSSTTSPKVERVSFNQTLDVCINYENQVPVYDGRSSSGRPFTFKPKDFDGLLSWPLYNDGKVKEIPSGSVVSVGYSIGDYGSTDKYLVTNVMFVILISTPDKVVA